MGCLVWGAAVAIGLGALLAASSLAYAAVKRASAAYLLWVGLNLISRPKERFDTHSGGRDDRPPIAFLKQGLLTNLLNPKAGVFYITFLPQFVPRGANVALFTSLLVTKLRPSTFGFGIPVTNGGKPMFGS